MPEQNIHVIVTVDALPAHVDEIKTGLRRLAEESRHETGCLAYAVVVDNANPLQMHLLEAWRDSTDLAAHRASAHVAHAIGSLQGKLAGAPQVRELTPLG